MKKKHLLMTIALAVATLTAAGQTVTPDGGSPIAADNLTANALASATTLKIDGTWTAEQVTKLRTAIAGDIFGSNDVLTTVTFEPNAMMGSMEYLFRNCTALTGVTMPTAENTDAVSFNNAFFGCTALTGTVNLSGFTKISEMINTFSGGCTALEGVTMPTKKNSNAVNFIGAFSRCTALKTVDLSGFTVISDMQHAFYCCTALEGVTMPTEMNSNAVTFESAFQGCAALKGMVNLSGFINISDMSYAFEECPALEGVTMPTADNTTVVTFQNAFQGCTALKGTVNLSGFNKISDMQYAFSGCVTLEAVTLPAANTSPADGISFNNAFSGCEALKGTVNLSGFTAIADMETAFDGCIALEGVTMPKENSATVSFLSAFYSCEALKTVDLSGFTAISSMRNTFNFCAALERVTLPAANTSPDAGISFYYAFGNCPALKTVDLSGFTAISEMQFAFKGSTTLEGVTLPAADNTTDVTFFQAFYGCPALKTVDLSKFTAISSMESAFNGCASLTSVKLGGTLPSNANYAFINANPNCLVYVPEGWTKPASGWDIIYIPGGTAEGNITLEENQPFRCPQTFALNTGNVMTYARTLTPNEWATVCLPFAAAVPEGCIAKELASSTGETVTFAQVQAMEANKPYIVAYTGSDATYSVTFTSEVGATIAATPAALETEPANASYKMAGTYADIREQSMYLLGDNSFLLYNKGNLHPFRAYITAANGQPNLAPRLAIGNDGGATGIGCIPALETEEIPAVSYVYSMDSRLVKTVPAEEYGTLKDGLARGVYIVNGQKVTVTE